MKDAHNDSDYVRTPSLPRDGVASIVATPKSKATQTAALQALLMLADVCDAIARKTITHVTIGTPRSGDSFLMTVNFANGGKRYIGGESVFGLVAEAYAENEVSETVAAEQQRAGLEDPAI